VYKWTSWVVQHYKIIIQDGGWIFAQTSITQPPIDVDEWNFASM